MKKIVVTSIKVLMFILFLPIAFYVTGFYIPYRILENEQFNGPAKYSQLTVPYKSKYLAFTLFALPYSVFEYSCNLH